MNGNSRVIGIAWRYDGIPTIKEYNAFLEKPDAVLRIVLVDGNVQAEIPLRMIPHSPMGEDHEYVLPEALRAGDIERWETPKEVSSLRLHLGDDSFLFLDKILLDQMRVAQKAD